MAVLLHAALYQRSNEGGTTQGLLVRIEGREKAEEKRDWGKGEQETRYLEAAVLDPVSAFVLCVLQHLLCLLLLISWWFSPLLDVSV